MKKIIIVLLLIVSHVRAEEIYSTFVVEAKRSANLAFTASGTVKEVNIDIASTVKKGDILAKLKSDDTKAALNIARTSLKFAKKEYTRQMRAKNVLSASRLEGYTAKYESAKAQLVYQRAILNKTVLKAPFAGIIYSKDIEVGDVVSGALLRTVIKIQSKTKRKLILSFDQKYWKSVKVGQTFNYTIGGDATKHVGIISKIYPSADAGNRKIKAEVEADGFMVGLFGDGTILVPDAK